MRTDRVAVLLTVLGSLFALAAPAATAELWVASQGNGRILEYDAETGLFDGALVEPTTTGFSFPGGIAIRASTARLYVASTLSGEIWSHETSTGALVTPPAATGLAAPGAMAFDTIGANLYFVADVPNGPDTDGALRRLAITTGSITTLATSPTASFAGIALQGSHAYLSDSVGGTVLRYAQTGGSPTTILSGLASPAGLLFTSPTTLLVAQSGSDRVSEYQEIAGSWTFVRTLLAPSAGVDGPFGLAIGPDGRISVSGAFSNDVVAVDPTSLNVARLIEPSEGLRVPGALAWHGSTLFVASRAGNVVRAFDASGAATGVVARGLSAPSDAGLAAATGNGLLFASAAANSIVEIDTTSGETVRTLSNVCPISFTRPFALAADALGRVYVTCPPIDGVRRFEPSGASTTLVSAGAGGLVSPRGVALGPSGNVFVASASGEVLEFSAATGALVDVFIDTTGNGGGPLDPYALLFRGDALFVTSYFPNEVREFAAATGAFRGVRVTSGAGGLSGPRALAFHASGDLLVASEGTDSVMRFDGDTGNFVGHFVAPGSGGLDAPYDLVMRSQSTPSVPILGLAARLALMACLIALGAGWWWLRPTEPDLEPKPIEVGETVEQLLPGPDGRPEVWRLEKREVDRAEAEAELLPRAQPLAEPHASDESVRALDAQALEAWRTGRLADALSLFEAAIAADPDDWLPRANYGRLLVMMADFAKAGPHLERAAELNPDSPRVWLDLYSHYQASLQLERAMLAYERAQALAGDRGIVQDGTGLWRLSDDSIYP